MLTVEFINKSYHGTELSDALIIQLIIFSYIDGINKKFTHNLSIDEEISLRGNRMVLSGIIYHEVNSLIAGIIYQELTWIIRGF